MRIAEGSKGRVAIVDGYTSYEPETAVFADLGYTVEVLDAPGTSHAEKISHVRGAAGVMVRLTEFGPDEFDALPELRYLVRYGAGYDNIDIPAAAARGVLVCNVRGYANHAVSDHALALTLACLRDFRRAPASFTETYSAPPRDAMPTLRELTLGIVGLGNIGGAMARKCHALFGRVIAHDPYVSNAGFVESGAERVDFDALLQESDVVSVHCNLSDETCGLFGQAAFGRMKPGAIFINTARGGVQDEAALLEALESGPLMAAGVDVWTEEPPGAALRPLIEHPRLFATGHYAWYSNSSRAELQRRAAENMAAMLRGERPADCLNPEAFQPGAG